MLEILGLNPRIVISILSENNAVFYVFQFGQWRITNEKGEKKGKRNILL